MKKVVNFLAVIVFFLTTAISQVNAQNYEMGAGFLADFGSDSSGGSFYGPHFKYNLNATGGIEADVLFGDGATLIQGAYQYHLPFASVNGLAGFFGGGAGVYLTDDDSVFTIPIMGGMEYTVTGAPLALSFDWRPRMLFIPGGDYYDSETEFKAGRFALGIRFTF